MKRTARSPSDSPGRSRWQASSHASSSTDKGTTSSLPPPDAAPPSNLPTLPLLVLLLMLPVLWFAPALLLLLLSAFEEAFLSSCTSSRRSWRVRSAMYFFRRLNPYQKEHQPRPPGRFRNPKARTANCHHSFGGTAAVPDTGTASPPAADCWRFIIVS